MFEAIGQQQPKTGCFLTERFCRGIKEEQSRDKTSVEDYWFFLTNSHDVLITNPQDISRRINRATRLTSDIKELSCMKRLQPVG